MLFGLRSMVLFSALTVASALGAGGDAALPEPNPAEPIVEVQFYFSKVPLFDCSYFFFFRELDSVW